MNIWNEGKYLDLWSLNHFLSGIVFAGWMFFFGLSIEKIFIVYFIIAVGWELYELLEKTRAQEYLGNKIMDVVTGIAGFFAVILYLQFEERINLYLLWSVTLAYVIMVILERIHNRGSNIIH